MQQAIRAIGTRLNNMDSRSLEKLGFYGLTREIGRLVGADGAAILLLDEDTRYMIQARAMVMDGEPRGNGRHDCLGTPCQLVANGRELLIARGLGELFAADELCEQCDLAGYAGVPLRRGDGKVFGLIAAFFREPIGKGDLVLEVLRIAARLVGAELGERMSRGESRRVCPASGRAERV